MTDLEALECIVVDLVPKAKEHNKDEIEQVRKSLEVLEILKSNVVSLNMIAIFETCEGYNDWAREYHRYGYLLTKEDFEKVKEWLENDK